MKNNKYFNRPELKADRLLKKNKKYLILAVVVFIAWNALGILYGGRGTDLNTSTGNEEGWLSDRFESMWTEETELTSNAVDTSLSSPDYAAYLTEIPEWDESAQSIIINNNAPYFTEEELNVSESYIKLTDLDSLGRCGVAMMAAGKDTMPGEEETRGEIGNVKPTGWEQSKYPEAIHEAPAYLYNRSHLLAWSLSSLNAEKRNLITGTRAMNLEMLDYEKLILKYLDEHPDALVLYRVTPVFEEDHLLANGVLMEAESISSDELSFCVYVYNAQPGIEIDYTTGKNTLK